MKAVKLCRLPIYYLKTSRNDCLTLSEGVRFNIIDFYNLFISFLLTVFIHLLMFWKMNRYCPSLLLAAALWRFCSFALHCLCKHKRADFMWSAEAIGPEIYTMSCQRLNRKSDTPKWRSKRLMNFDGFILWTANIRRTKHNVTQSFKWFQEAYLSYLS